MWSHSRLYKRDNSEFSPSQSTELFLDVGGALDLRACSQPSQIPLQVSPDLLCILGLLVPFLVAAAKFLRRNNFRERGFVLLLQVKGCSVGKVWGRTREEAGPWRRRGHGGGGTREEAGPKSRWSQHIYSQGVERWNADAQQTVVFLLSPGPQLMG